MNSSQDIAQYKEDGLAVLSETSVRSYMLVLRRFFAYLHQEGWIRRNPMLKVRLPKARARRDCLRPLEVGPVLDTFWRIEPLTAPIATTLVLGGWRKGEIVNLRRTDADLESRWAYVLDFEGDELTAAWSPKTESSLRAVPLHRLVVCALRRVEPVICPDGRVSPWVFPINDRRKRRRYRDKLGRQQPVCGDRRSPGTAFFGSKLRGVLDAVGIERNVTVHGLRRTFAVLLQEAGAPQAVIQQALGHKPVGVTAKHYLPPRDALVQKWVDAIEVSIPALSDPSPETREKSATPVPPENPKSESEKTDSHCHQSATKPVANRPPYLRVIK